MCRNYDDVTHVALAPLTNIVMFLKAYPHLKSRIKEIALMGGSIHGDNILLCAEFNLYADTHAAHIVFNSGFPISIAPIEICSFSLCTIVYAIAISHPSLI